MAVWGSLTPSDLTGPDWRKWAAGEPASEQPLGLSARVKGQKGQSDRTADKLRTTSFSTFAINKSEMRMSKEEPAGLQYTPEYTLMIRRVSTVNEMFHEEERGMWLQDALKRIFHREQLVDGRMVGWQVVDIAIFRSSAKKSLKNTCRRQSKPARQCTAFITFGSKEAPNEIIRAHREDQQSKGLCWHLRCCFEAFAFLCPSLNRVKICWRSKPTQEKSELGWSKEMDALGKNNWEMHPGPAREDIVWDKLNYGDKWCEGVVPQVQHHRKLRALVSTVILFILSSFMIFPLSMVRVQDFADL